MNAEMEDDNQPNGNGNEGRKSRKYLLQDALDKTVDKCISSVKFSLISKGFPSVYRNHKEELKSIHTLFCDALKENMKLEIQTLFEEEDLPVLLDELDAIVKGTPTENPAWRPSGVPEDDVRAHLMKIRQCQRNKLQFLLDKEQKTTRHLESLLNHHKNKIQQLKAKSQQMMDVFTQGYEEGKDCLSQIKIIKEAQTNSTADAT